MIVTKHWDNGYLCCRDGLIIGERYQFSFLTWLLVTCILPHYYSLAHTYMFYSLIYMHDTFQNNKIKLISVSKLINKIKLT